MGSQSQQTLGHLKGEGMSLTKNRPSPECEVSILTPEECGITLVYSAFRAEFVESSGVRLLI
jgi:hypothetical protein